MTIFRHYASVSGKPTLDMLADAVVKGLGGPIRDRRGEVELASLEVAADAIDEPGNRTKAKMLRDLARCEIKPGSKGERRREQLAHLVDCVLRYRSGEWHSASASGWMKLSELDDQHLLNCAGMILHGQKNTYRRVSDASSRRWAWRCEPLMLEVVRRGLLLRAVPKDWEVAEIRERDRQERQLDAWEERA